MKTPVTIPECFHRVTIKGLCVRDGKLLLIKEGERLSGKWELPGGGLDFGEDIRLGFEREIEEEMGLTVAKMSKWPIYVWSHGYENNSRNIGPYHAFVVAYRVEFEHLNIRPTDECAAIEFFSKDELLSMGLDGQISRLGEVFNPADFTSAF